MAYKAWILVISMVCSGFCSYQQETEQVRMTMLSNNHFQSEVNSHYQCRLSYPDNYQYWGNPTSVESFRSGNTRNLEDENQDPPAAFYDRRTNYPHFRVEMINGGNNNAFGVFGCRATKYGKKETTISTTRMRSDAHIVPSNGLFTQTVSLGDVNVTIGMRITTDEFPVSALRWRNNSNLWTGSEPGNDTNFGTDTFEINEPAKLYHAGIYECHQKGNRASAMHGLNLLIVRACPHKKWGPPDCGHVCESCYNGGVCDENTGQCVCAPGFMGTKCLTACGGNRFGYDCQKRCTYHTEDPKDKCGGTLFCLIHPFGCRCNTGFQGLACNEACASNTFGASCLQPCHCTSDQCNRYTGECIGDDNSCDPGWTGVYCQVECNDGYFGSGCNQECHCSPELCDKETGLCESGGCLPQWVDLFPPYYCQTGLQNATFTKVNPHNAVPVNCTAIQGPGGNLTGFDIVLSKSRYGLDTRNITLDGITNKENTKTNIFRLETVDEDVVYCQLRNHSNTPVAVLEVQVVWYDLPVLPNAPMRSTLTNSSVTIRWSAWDRYDVGDPPVIKYIPYYRGKENLTWIPGSPVYDADGYPLQFTFNELESDVDYSFCVAAVREGDGGEGPRSPSLEVKTKCAVPLEGPREVMVDIAGERQELVNISWKHPSINAIRCRSGIQQFRIYYASRQAFSNEGWVEVTDPTATSNTISNLNVGTRYVFEMTLTTEGGESDRSDRMQHLVPELPRLSSTPVSINRTSGTITISWDAWNEIRDRGNSPVISYKVYYIRSDFDVRNWNFFMTYEAVDGQLHYYATVTNLTPDTRYDFSVTAVREGHGGEGERSPPLTNQKTMCIAPENGPQEINVNVAGEKQELVRISWRRPAVGDISCKGGVLMFRIYYSLESSISNNEGVVMITNSQLRFYTITGLKVGETYTFGMTLTTEGGESARSDEIQHIIPNLPKLSVPPKVSDVASTTMKIYWEAWNGTRDKGTPPVVLYKVYYKRSSESDTMWHNVIFYTVREKFNIYHAAVNGLTADTRYDFKVAAVREGYGGEGEPSPPLKNIKTLCNVPLSGPRYVTARIAGENQELVEIFWKNPSSEAVRCSTGVMHFTIYYKSNKSNDELLVDVDNSLATSFVIHGLKLGEEYVFYMTLTTSGGESGESRRYWHHVPELPMLRSDLSSKDNECGEITIVWHSWTKNDDVGSPPIFEYNIYHKPISSALDWIKSGTINHFSNKTLMEHTFRNLVEGEIYDFAIAVVREHNGEGGKRTYQEQINTCPAYTGAIVGSLMGSLLFILLLVFVIILWKRRKSIGKTKEDKKEHVAVVNQAYTVEPHEFESSTASKEFPEDDDVAVYANVERPAPILLRELENYIRTTALEQQFLMFKNESRFPSIVGEKEENKTKNRFKNMVAYDHSRVVLPQADDDPHSDYYNANYLKNAKGEISFIASQGPNKASVEDFWRMVWMEKVSNIVMLTNLIEKGKDRCFRYWPSCVGKIAVFGTVKVKWRSSDQYANFDIRDYTIIVEEKFHQVRNWHFKTWPDKDIPDQPSPLIEFARRIKMQQQSNPVPLLVHCSAGVGRTGTFIALYSLLGVVEANEKLDVYGFVGQMREDRISMVQTSKQYKFLHECLLEAYLTGDTAISWDKFQGFDVKREFEKLSREFKYLAKFDRMSRNAASGATNNLSKCRFPEILPVEKRRLFLQSQGKNTSNNYINACSVTTYRKESSFIATQSPLPSTIEDFWRLVYDWKCPLIVMLNQLDDNDETVCKYWPDSGSSHYGHIIVKLKEKQNKNQYIFRLFEVDHMLIRKPVSVQHLQLHSWDDKNVWNLYSFVEEIDKLQKDFSMVEPTVVHCINGVGRTGVAIAVKSEMERIKAEKKIDVFTTVRQMRGSNHNLVHTLEEYSLCHQLLKMNSPEATYVNI